MVSPPAETSVALLASGCEVFTHSCTAVGCVEGADREARLRAAMRVALDEFDDGKFGG